MDSYVLNQTNTSFSSDDEQTLKNRQRLIQVSILFILAILGFILNFYVMIRIAVKKVKRPGIRLSNIDYLMLQLAIADVMVAGFCVLADGIWKITYEWLGGDLVCRMVKYMQMFSLYASTNIIVTISLDRMIVITNPLPRFDQHNVIKFMTAGAWLLAAICSIPQAIVFGVLKAPFLKDGKDFNQCVTHGTYNADWEEKAYVIFTLCVIFVVPLILIFVSYSVIYLRLRKETQLLATSDSASEQSERAFASRGVGVRKEKFKKAKRNALWISAVVILAFIVCWAPYHLAMIYSILISKEHRDQTIAPVLQHVFFFGMCDCVVNPFIYGCFHLIKRRSKAVSRQNTDFYELTRLLSEKDPSIRRKFELNTETSKQLGNTNNLTSISLIVDM